MLEVLFYSALLLLCLVGIAAIIHWSCLKFFQPKDGSFIYAVIPLERSNAEYRLRTAHEILPSFGDRLCKRIIAVDMGLDEEERLVCNRLQELYGNITLCEPDDLGETLYYLNIIPD